MSSSLIEMASAVARLEQELLSSSGEITTEIEQLLEIKDLALPHKIDAYHHTVDRLEMMQDFYKQKADQLLTIARSFQHAAERMKANLKTAAETMGQNEVEGVDYRMKLVPTKGTVIVEDIEKLPGKFIITETVTKPDKKEIQKAIESGEVVDGARLEPGLSLRWYRRKT